MLRKLLSLDLASVHNAAMKGQATCLCWDQLLQCKVSTLLKENYIAQGKFSF